MQTAEQNKNSTYLNYWKRKEILQNKLPHFKTAKWWPSSTASESEQIIINAVIDSKNILDIGAGDFSFRNKLSAAGFRGQYDSLDIGTEFKYTYRSVDEVKTKYEAILMLDVLEHLALADGIELLNDAHRLVTPNGIIVIQTPNGKCVRSQYGTDMTHLHIYNLPDLWSYISAMGYDVQGYRLEFTIEKLSFFNKILRFFSRLFITKVIGADYTDNILLICTKQNV